MPAPPATLSDQQVATGLARGDLDAMNLVYERYGALSYSVALRILGDPGRAEDVVQDSFLKLWRSAGQFDAGRGSLRTWLLTAVRNRAIDYLRGRGAHERREGELSAEIHSQGAGSDPWHEVSLSLERDAVREALDVLPVEQKQAVELSYFGGYTSREIAQMTRVPLSTVKGRMRLALEKMHSYLHGRGVMYG